MPVAVAVTVGDSVGVPERETDAVSDGVPVPVGDSVGVPERETDAVSDGVLVPVGDSVGVPERVMDAVGNGVPVPVGADDTLLVAVGDVDGGTDALPLVEGVAGMDSVLVSVGRLDGVADSLQPAPSHGTAMRDGTGGEIDEVGVFGGEIDALTPAVFVKVLVGLFEPVGAGVSVLELVIVRVRLGVLLGVPVCVPVWLGVPV